AVDDEGGRLGDERPGFGFDALWSGVVGAQLDEELTRPGAGAKALAGVVEQTADPASLGVGPDGQAPEIDRDSFGVAHESGEVGSADGNVGIAPVADRLEVVEESLVRLLGRLELLPVGARAGDVGPRFQSLAE